jgi:hypothetical protein
LVDVGRLVLVDCSFFFLRGCEMKLQLSEAIAEGWATLGWNARPEGWVWVAFDGVAAWVHPEWAERIVGAEV